MNQLIIDNLNLLIAAVEAQPEPLFSLRKYREEAPCGTLFCTAGLAATMPEFNAQGMCFGPSGLEAVIPTINGVFLDSSRPSDPLFGENAWNNIFAGYNDGARDDILGGVYAMRENGYGEMETEWTSPLMADKDLALARLRKQLEVELAKVEADTAEESEKE